MKHAILASLASVKAVAFGGPVAVAFSAVGAVVVGVALSGHAGEHFDAAAVIGVTLVVLGFVEWALARRFAAHEVVEAAQYERVASIADSAAEAVSASVRVAREHAEAVNGFRTDLRTVLGETEALERRVTRLEERVLRPGLAASLPRPGGGGL